MEIKTLGTVATYINGRAFKPAEWEATGKQIIRIQNLTNKYAPYNYSTRMYEEKYLVHDGDLLFAWSASLGAHIWKGKDAWLNQHIFRVIPNVGINRDYLYYYLLTVVAELYAKTHGSGMVHITKAPFMNTPIPVPTLPEQERIVARIEELFSQLDAGVETLKKTKAQLAVYRQAVFASVIGKYDGAERTLSDVAITVDGDRGKNYPKKKEFTKEGYCLFLTAANVKQYGWAFEDNTFISREKDSMLHGGRLVKNDIVITTRGTLGNVAVYDDTVPYSAVRINSCMLIVRVTDYTVSPYYLAQYLMSPMFKYQVAKLKSGTAQPQIPANVLREIPLKIPTRDIQTAIIDELTEEFSVCDSIEQTVDAALQQAEAMRQSILKDAFKGRL